MALLSQGMLLSGSGAETLHSAGAAVARLFAGTPSDRAMVILAGVFTFLAGFAVLLPAFKQD